MSTVEEVCRDWTSQAQCASGDALALHAFGWMLVLSIALAVGWGIWHLARTRGRNR